MYPGSTHCASKFGRLSSVCICVWLCDPLSTQLGWYATGDMQTCKLLNFNFVYSIVCMRFISLSVFPTFKFVFRFRNFEFFVYKMLDLSRPNSWRQAAPAKDCLQPWQGRVSDLNATNMYSRLLYPPEWLEKLRFYAITIMRIQWHS